jgi:hypothetical protein
VPADCCAKDPDLNGFFLTDNVGRHSVFCTPHCVSTIVNFQHPRFYSFCGQCIVECVCSSSNIYVTELFSEFPSFHYIH